MLLAASTYSNAQELKTVELSNSAVLTSGASTIDLSKMVDKPVAKKLKKNGYKASVVDTLLAPNNFDALVVGGTLPAEFSSTGTGFGWELDTVDVTLGFAPVNDHGVSLYSNDSKYDDAGNSVVTSDTLLINEFSYAGELALIFDYFSNNGASGAVAEVIASVDGAAWASLVTLADGTEWQTISVVAPVATATVAFAIVYNDNGTTDKGLAVDNIQVIEAVADVAVVSDFSPYYGMVNTNQLPAELTVIHVVENGNAKTVEVFANGDISFGGSTLSNFNLVPDYILPYGEENTNVLVNASTVSPTNVGVYSGSVFTTTVPSDIEQSDNISDLAFAVTDTLISLDNGIVSPDPSNASVIGTGLDIGLGLPVTIANIMIAPFDNKDTIRGITISTIAGNTPGATFSGEIFSVVGGAVTTTSLAQTTVGTIGDGSEETILLKFVDGSFEVAAGDTIALVLNALDNAGTAIGIKGSSRQLLTNSSLSNVSIPGLGNLGNLANEFAPFVRLVTGEDNSTSDAHKLDFVVATSAASGYTFVPKLQTNVDILGRVANTGNVDETGATVEVTAVDASTTTVQSESIALGDIVAGDTADFVNTPMTFATEGVYTINANIAYPNSAEELTPANNTVSFSVNVTDTSYSRFNPGGAALTTFTADFGAGDVDVEIGSILEVFQADTVTSITFYLNSFLAGDEVVISLYPLTGSGASLALGTSLAAITHTFAADDDNTGTVAPIKVGLPKTSPIVLNPGLYMVSVKRALGTEAYQPIASAGGQQISVINGGVLQPAASNKVGRLGVILNFGHISYVGIGENEGALATVNMFPNPSNGSVTITNAANTTLVVTDLAGKVVATKSLISDNEKVQLDLNNGTYLVKVSNALGTKVAKLQVVK